MSTPNDCRLGYVEYDNTAYCFEHHAFTPCDNPVGKCREAEKEWAAWRETHHPNGQERKVTDQPRWVMAAEAEHGEVRRVMLSRTQEATRPAVELTYVEDGDE